MSGLIDIPNLYSTKQNHQPFETSKQFTEKFPSLYGTNANVKGRESAYSITVDTRYFLTEFH